MSFKKNQKLEDLLGFINTILEPAELLESEKIGRPKYPNIFLLGSPRCGSTFFTQWAASLKAFSYPSNFLSRFYKAPYIGALIYKLVTDEKYQYRNEFSDIRKDLEFTSSIGKTAGFTSPHEFWYFWRRFIDFPEIPFHNNEFEENFDFTLFQKELALIQDALGAPFLIKGKIVNWYLKSMGENVQDVIYLHMYRDPVATIRSLINARIKWTGNREEWFSWKPREFDMLKDLDVISQVAGQIYFIEKEILENRKYLGANYLAFSYEDLCINPEEVYNLITSKIKAMAPNYEVPEYTNKKTYIISNPTSKEDELISEALSGYENKYGKLIYK